MVEMGGYGEGAFDVSPGEFSDSGEVSVGEGMAEVEEEHRVRLP
jgi:hypothetical protein